MKQAVERQRAGIENNRQKADAGGNEEAGVEFYSKELNLADSSLSEEVLIQAMVENPKLMERPIVVANGKARIGRPPEQVLEIVG